MSGKRVKSVNVVLVGSVGSGKSTFGNYLCNFGLALGTITEPVVRRKLFEQMQEGLLFPAGHSGASVTKETTKKTFLTSATEFNVRLRVHLIDTPGLMEGLEDDAVHMVELFKFIRKLKKVHAVIYCTPWNNRLLDEQRQALNYYQRLFAPVFAKGNAVLVGTKFDEESYETLLEEGTLEQTIDRRLEEVNSVLEQPCGFSLCHFVQSFRAQKRLAQFLKTTLYQGKRGDESVHYRSYLVRGLLFGWLAQTSSVSMLDHRFPLPPGLHNDKEHFRRLLQARVEQLRETVKIENFLSDTVLNNVDVTYKRLNKKKKGMLALEELIKSLAGPQRTSSFNTCGNDLIRLFNAGTHVFSSPIPNYTLRAKKFNADYDVVEEKDVLQAGNKLGKLVTVQIKPYWINLGKKDDLRWFCYVHLEYDGEIHHRNRLRDERAKRKLLRAEIACLEADVNTLNEQKAAHQHQLQQHVDSLLRLENDIQILSPELFSVEELPRVIGLFNPELSLSFPEEEKDESEDEVGAMSEAVSGEDLPDDRVELPQGSPPPEVRETQEKYEQPQPEL